MTEDVRSIDLDALEALLVKATPGPWRAMRDGNQYIKGTLVGASCIEEVRRPWNYQAIAVDNRSVSRFTDADADLICTLRNAAPQILAIARAVKEWGKAEDAAHKDAETDPSAWLAHHMACLDEDNPEQCPAHRHAGIAYQAVELIAQELAER